MKIENRDVGKLLVNVRISPNVVSYIDRCSKNLLADNKIDVNNFLMDTKNDWSSKILNFIKTESLKLYNADFSKRFEIARVSSKINDINNVSGATFNETYESVFVRLKESDAFFDIPEFQQIITILRKLYRDPSLMGKLSFTFSNRLNCVYIFGKSPNEMFVISNKSKRYISADNFKIIEEFRKYLNSLFIDEILTTKSQRLV